MLVLEREIRARRWSNAEAARRSGLNQVTVGMVLNGRLKPYPSQLAKLATAIGWPLERVEELLVEVG